jgi:mono/diheme cytochrome c family protein
MALRIRIALVFAILLSLTFVVPAFAGGWAVITLDELPTNIVAGDTFEVGFTVRQHGHTPMDGLAPTVTASLYKEMQFVVHAQPGDKPGHYTASLTFPKEGEWTWSIQAFSMDQPMPVLQVAAPGAGKTDQHAGQSERIAAAVPLLVILRGLALVIGLGGLILAYQRRSRLAVALTVAAVLIGAASFLTGSAVPAVEAQSDASLSQVEFGRQLFVAKGCITCHANRRVDPVSRYWTIEMGAPDLSTYSSSPEILFTRLKDPAAAKSDTKMPNLELKKTEIEALIAFINSK